MLRCQEAAILKKSFHTLSKLGALTDCLEQIITFFDIGALLERYSVIVSTTVVFAGRIKAELFLKICYPLRDRYV